MESIGEEQIDESVKAFLEAREEDEGEDDNDEEDEEE